MAFPKALLDDEFTRMKAIPQNALNNDVVSFLERSQKKIQSQGMHNDKGPLTQSLIHYAAMGDCIELLLHLLDLGIPVDDRDQNNRTPLSWAAEYCSYNAAKILVESGAKVNSLCDTYCSPLTWLKYGAHTESPGLAATKKYLEEHGATHKGAKRGWMLRRIGLL